MFLGLLYNKMVLTVNVVERDGASQSEQDRQRRDFGLKALKSFNSIRVEGSAKNPFAELEHRRLRNQRTIRPRQYAAEENDYTTSPSMLFLFYIT